MSHILLIHGAWHWGGCWRYVSDILVAHGYEVYAPSLPMAAGETLEAHIDAASDVATAVSDDLVVVSHSFGGFVAAGLLARYPAKFRHAVFLDAWLPEQGKDFFDVAMPRWGRGLLRYVAGKMDLLPPLHSPKMLGVTDPEQAQWLQAHLVRQPTATLVAPFPYDLTRFSGPATYIHCLQGKKSRMPAHFADMPRRARAMGWAVAEIQSGHDAMITAPGEVAAVIDEAARTART